MLFSNLLRRFLLALTSSTLLLHAGPGAVLTTDGRKLEGDVRFTNDALVLTLASGASVIVPATNIVRAQLSTNVMAAKTKGSGNGLLGVYFNTANLAGAAFMRLDQQVDFHWPKAPLLGVPENNFSVRWMGYLEAPTTDTYTLHFGCDDGGRMFLDGQLVAEGRAREVGDETSFVVNLNAGERRKLKLELFNYSGPSRGRFFWSTPLMPRTIVPQDRLYAASFDSEHQGTAADLAGKQGLLATYYNSTDFTNGSFSRIDSEIDFDWKRHSPAPGLGSNDFSVRWTGNVLVTNSGEYRFWILCGAPVRFYINDELLSNPPWISLLQHVLPAKLQSGDRCELRLEMRITNNIVPVKLFWSGPGFERTPLARQHLSPVVSPGREVPAGGGPSVPAGIVLASGAIVSAPIVSANASSIRLGGALAGRAIPVTKVARIHMKPVTGDLAAVIPKGRAGVLLRNRDFIDGDFAGVENGRLKIESVLFGGRTLNLDKDVLVVVLRQNEPPPWRISLTARDGTVLYGRRLLMDAQRAGLAEAPDVLMPITQIVEIADGEVRGD